MIKNDRYDARMELKDLLKIKFGLPPEPIDFKSLAASLAAGLTSGYYATTEALGTTEEIQKNLLAALYQDDDAHDTCSLTACLNPLHPGPCKGWKGTLFNAAPGAWHALEGAKVEKANAARLKKIADLKAKGLPIPKKLLTPIVAKPHPHAGQTAKSATGEAHAAGKAVSEAAGVKVNTPGKITLGQAVKTLPVQKGPKGKKPTLASKGIAFVIAQEKVTDQYKLDKTTAITPEQWAGLSAEDKATIRGELAKIKKDGFGPQQKKASELLDKLADEPAPHTKNAPPSGKITLKEMTEPGAPPPPPLTEAEKAAKAKAAAAKAAKDKAAADVVAKAKAAGAPKVTQAFESDTATSMTPVNLGKLIHKQGGSADIMIGGKKITVGFEGGNHEAKLTFTPGLNSGTGHYTVTTKDGEKYQIGKGESVKVFPAAPTPSKPEAVPAADKPKPLPAHVQNAIDMANGHAPGASWSKNHLAAYQPLTAEQFHSLPPATRDKIVAELQKGQSKFLDPKKVAAATALLEKFGHGQSKPKPTPAADKTVDFAKDLHSHDVTQAQANDAVAKTPMSAHFLAAKQTAGLTDEDNPDSPQHLKTAQSEAEALVEQKTKLYDTKILTQAAVDDAIGNLQQATAAQLNAQLVHDAKLKAFNKVNLTLTNHADQLSPIEKASLQHYKKYLLHHPSNTSVVEIDQLKATAKQADNDLTEKLHAALKKANAPKPVDMSPTQIADAAEELLGPYALVPNTSLSLGEMQAFGKQGAELADAAAENAPLEALSDPAVAAKWKALASINTQILATKAELTKLDEHLQKHHGATISKGVDVNGNPLTTNDKDILFLHAAQLAKQNVHLNNTLKGQLAKLDDATEQFDAAAAKVQPKPAELLTLSSYDQANIPDFYANAWSKQASKAFTYGIKTYQQQQEMKADPDYPALTQELGQLKKLAGEVALAHAEEHTAAQNVPTDPETGVLDHNSPQWAVWQEKVDQREQKVSQFNALHKVAQQRSDKIRTAAGLKKRALPKPDSAAVKASAAESAAYKTGGYSGPNYGKPAAAKNYLLAKVGPKLAVVHKSAGEKKLDKMAGPAPSTPKIENVPGEPVKLGGGDSNIASIPAPLKKQITTDFKQMPKGKYLADPAEDIFDNLVTLAAAHGKTVPDGLSVDQVVKTIDETHSKNLGVANGGMLQKKITDWLGTTAGKQYAESHSTPDAKMVKHLSGELDLPAGVTLGPGEKVQKLAGPGPHDEGLASSAFKAVKTPQAQESQDAYMKASGTKWSPQQKSALKSYTGSAYTTYNNYLRGDGTASTSVKQDVIDIQSAMMPLQQHTLLKRGTGWGAIPAQFHGGNASKMIGKTFEEPGFVSTTVAGESGHFNGPLQLEIEAPIGTPAAFVNSISHFKNQENEMLLAAGTKFKVISVSVKGHQTVMRVRIVGDK